MDVLELYLYVGLAVGWVAGRLRPARGPWLPRLTFASVLVLIGLLGASFRDIAVAEIFGVLPGALVFALLLFATTTIAYVALRRWGPGGPHPSAPAAEARREPIPTTAVLVASLVAGFGVGRAVALPTGLLIPLALAVLLAFVGYGLELSWTSMRRAWVPILSAAAGAVAAAVLAVFVARLPLAPSFATALGFGWYSLTGPLVAARFGATLGLFAFLVNFVRESGTMLLAPYAGRRLGAEGLAAIAGATGMDTTLYFIVRYGDRRAGALAVASGLTLTVAASLIVPLVLAV